MFKIGYTKRSHAVVLKELCCTQFFKLYFWNRQNYWRIGGEELQNASVKKEIKWEECTK